MIYELEEVKKQTIFMLTYRLAIVEKKLEMVEKKLDNVRKGLFARNAENERKYGELSHGFEEIKAAMCQNTQGSEEKVVQFNAAM